MDLADRLGLHDATIDRTVQSLTDVDSKLDETGESEDLLTRLHGLLTSLARDPSVCRERALKSIEKRLANLAMPDFGGLLNGLAPEIRQQAIASKEAQYKADAERRMRNEFYVAFTKEKSRPPKAEGEVVPTRAERAASIAAEAIALLPQVREHIVARIALEASAVQDTLSLNPESLQTLSAWRRTVRAESFAALTEQLLSMITLGVDREKVVPFRIAAAEWASERLAQLSTPEGTRFSGARNGSTQEHADALALLNVIEETRNQDRDVTLVAAVEVVDALQTCAETLLGGEATIFRRPQSAAFPLPDAWIAGAYNPMRLRNLQNAKQASADLDARLRADTTGRTTRRYF